MHNTDPFEQDWRDRGLGRPFVVIHPSGPRAWARHDSRGIRKERPGGGRPRPRWKGGAPPFAFDGRLCRAGEFWRAGEKALAQIHLALMGLPKIDEADAYRLFLAGTALEKGLDPSDLMKALGLPRAARDIEKYNPDEPRVPAGSGRESGQWTSEDGDGAGRTTVVERVEVRVVGATMSDANLPGILAGAQYAQLSPTPTISEETINDIIRKHGPNASIKKGAFNAEYAND